MGYIVYGCLLLTYGVSDMAYTSEDLEDGMVVRIFTDAELEVNPEWAESSWGYYKDGHHYVSIYRYMFGAVLRIYKDFIGEWRGDGITNFSLKDERIDPGQIAEILLRPDKKDGCECGAWILTGKGSTALARDKHSDWCPKYLGTRPYKGWGRVHMCSDIEIDDDFEII